MASASFLDGLALAATLTGDRGKAAEAGLAPELARSLDARVQEIRAADTRGRQRALGAIAVGLRPAIDAGAMLPARGAAILASEVPRTTGAAWMARAPLPRPGFRASAGLRATLRRLAGAPVDEAADRARGAVLAIERDERSATFVRIAIATGRDVEATLGAMERGAREGGDDRGARAGRELAALWERGCRG
ncbi:hypothetical protein [Sandaracinus amylolyticus]|uniref:hypothetical protein n=1 Tax=Sandaracinus amylolyticus TaxID=927083 RepID=UPI001F43B3D5|nr:hypothetical protein [Sandaracinus amylolyticus]UJR79175.1 Hypothetical protein I5071_12080 [Sandaracinus amylolyticus]